MTEFDDLARKQNYRKNSANICHSCFRAQKNKIYQNNPARRMSVVITTQNKRAKMVLEAQGRTYRPLDAMAMLKLYEATEACIHCGDLRAESPQAFHLDHIQPLAGGGKHVEENVRFICGFCNRAKHDASPEVFEAWVDRIRSRAVEGVK